MRITATFYIDVISSWCYWAEPAWQKLKKNYEGRVQFEWKVALMDKSGLPVSVEQHEWFYRRSGVMMRSPFKLKSDWCKHDETEFLAPNCVAKAAADLGATDDRVRLALAHAALREGQSVGEWDTAAEVGAKAGGLKIKELLERAQLPAIEKRVREETADYHRLQVTQRPTFVFDSEIGDRAILSGFAKVEPLAAALDSMIEDCAAYESHGVHYGAPPA